MRDESKHLKVALLVAGLMLCVAAIPILPYSYYTLLRWIVFGVAAYAAIKFRNNPSLNGHFIPLVLLAILFNPLMPVFLTRLLWLPIDLGSAVYFLVISKKVND